MNVEKILKIFYLWPIFELIALFSVHTLVIEWPLSLLGQHDWTGHSLQSFFSISFETSIFPILHKL